MIDYKVEWLPLKNLSVVWFKSQRPFNEKWAHKIASEFDPDLFEPMIVTKPNGAGVYHIIDGQHRRKGAEIFASGDLSQKFPCRIIAEADPSRAAKIFLGINEGRRAINPTAAFLVAIEAKRDLEVSINHVVRRAGYHVADIRNENCISAVGALKRIYHYGPEILEDTLKTCRLLWGSDSAGVSGKIISGTGLFVNEFGRYVDSLHLRKSVTGKYGSPGNFLVAARNGREKTFESMDFAMSELIRMTYNKGRPEDKKLKRKVA